jgi:hypothetical protein
MNLLHGMCTHMGSDNSCTFADQMGHIPVDKGVKVKMGHIPVDKGVKEKRKDVKFKGRRNVQSVVVKEHTSVSSAGMLSHAMFTQSFIHEQTEIISSKIEIVAIYIGIVSASIEILCVEIEIASIEIGIFSTSIQILCVEIASVSIEN